jgi:MoxR-like ATPase
MTTSETELSLDDVIVLLRSSISERLKHDFVGKEQVVDLMVLCAVAREHLLLVGPPGTAKSELVKRFVLLLGARKGSDELFEYLLTRFTEPNEIFGPVNIKEFQQGTFTRNIARALPSAKIAFLDEVFKANSAILNALLTILNERFFFNGLEQIDVPLISVFGATNEVPEGDELGALFDRFLLRVRTDNVDEHLFPELLAAGWGMEQERIRRGRNEEIRPLVPSLDALKLAYDALEQIKVQPIYAEYRELVRQIRAEGIGLSDRRAVKLLKLIAAAALLREDREGWEASLRDLWVLLHIWNKPEQISALQAIVGPVVERAGGRAVRAERDLDELARELARVRERAALEGVARTPTFYGVLLHDLERTRTEMLGHSAGRGSDGVAARWQSLLDEVEQLTDTVLDQLEAEERI